MKKDWTKWLQEQGIEVKPYVYIPYQREWQREKKAIGLCVSCGRNKVHYLSKCRCESCLIKNREIQRRYRRNHGLVKGTKKYGGGRPKLTKDAPSEATE